MHIVLERPGCLNVRAVRDPRFQRPMPGQKHADLFAAEDVDDGVFERVWQCEIGQARHVGFHAVDLFVPARVRVILAEFPRRAVVQAGIVHRVIDDHEIEMLVLQQPIFRQAVASGQPRVGQIENASGLARDFRQGLGKSVGLQSQAAMHAVQSAAAQEQHVERSVVRAQVRVEDVGLFQLFVESRVPVVRGAEEWNVPLDLPINSAADLGDDENVDQENRQLQQPTPERLAFFIFRHRKIVIAQTPTCHE